MHNICVVANTRQDPPALIMQLLRERPPLAVKADASCSAAPMYFGCFDDPAREGRQ